VLQIERETHFSLRRTESETIFESLTAKENPQRAADRILEQYRSGNDDALVLITRLTGISP